MVSARADGTPGGRRDAGAATVLHVRPVHILPGGSGMERRGYHHGNLREALIRAALEPDRGEGAGGVHLRRGRALGRGQPGRALPPLPRPRRSDGRRGAAGLHAVRGHAGAGVERRPARRADRLRQIGKAYLAFARDRARLLFGDVRVGPAARRPSATCSRPATGRSRSSRRGRRDLPPAAAGQEPAGR